MAGSWLVLAAYSIVYLVIALALGLLISTFSQTQQVAMSFAQLLTMLPTLILSGFIFPVASMPIVLRGLSFAIPAKYYIQVIRGIMMKGESWFPVQGGVMLFMAAALLFLATKRFKERLE